jgi:hypothetical protein
MTYSIYKSHISQIFILSDDADTQHGASIGNVYSSLITLRGGLP